MITDPQSSEAFPLLGSVEPDRFVAWRGGEPITVQGFVSTALALAEQLPRKRHVLNLCEDRYNFALSFAAALIARQISLLPPSRAPEVLRKLQRDFSEAYCITDQPDAPAGLLAITIAPQLGPRLQTSEIPVIPAGQIAAVAFTSGSTGAPKPQQKTWGSLVRTARALCARFELSSSAPFQVLGTVPPQHMYGLETTIMLPWQSGAALVPAQPLLPGDIAHALRAMRAPRWLITTPVHLRACASSGAALPELAGIVCATSPLDLELARTVETRYGRLFEIYGCTEAGSVAVRRTLSGPEWRVLDGLKLKHDRAGTWVKGGHVLESVLLPDRMTLHGEERFILHGRSSDMVKIAGKRASLEGLNWELNRIPGVRDGVFFLPSSPRGSHNTRLAALVVAPGMTEQAILAVLKNRIDAAFLPRPLLLVDALPRNATGKLPREGLVALARKAVRRESA
jgi:acyl-coenzyme A synthetase/AMP-(fatty) acid ligase